MRVWDQIQPRLLCRPHLLGEHNEIGTIHAIVTDSARRKGGAWRNHPEVRRWVGRADALKIRHDALVVEARRRGWPMGRDHKTPLPWVGDSRTAPDPIDNQLEKLRAKSCECRA